MANCTSLWNQARGKVFWRLGALLALFPLALTSPAVDSPPADPRLPDRVPVVALFSKPEPAKNPVELHLLVDAQKVLGWISGTHDWAGEHIAVQVGGKTEKVRVAQGNTFTWDYKVAKPTAIEFSAALGYQYLSRSVTLTPPDTTEPSVFFVVDRTVYRPGQLLHFAGFLRQPDGRGEFVPLPNRTVEVVLTAEKKKNTTAKLKLTADDFGRIVGAYSFVEADPLDNYILSVPGYKGTAKVVHAEFRKSKIKLKIDGKIQGDKLALKFDAVDFLDKPVPGSKVQFSAQVLRQAAKEKSHALKAEEFVYQDGQSFGVADPEDLPEDELLLFEAGATPFPLTYGPQGKVVVAQLSGDVSLEATGSGEYTIDLQKEWLKGNGSVVVQGVLIDVNGREQRASYTIRLDSDQADRLQLSTPKRYYEVNEPIEVKAGVVDAAGKPVKASSTLVAMQLAAATVTPRHALYGYDAMPHHYRSARLSAAWHGNLIPAYGRRWNVVDPEETTQRTMATAVVFQNDTAKLKLSKPGAYKLVVVTHLPDDTKLQREIGCVVRHRDDAPALMLKLDQADYEAGAILTGEIHSRFADACVLLTIRDSTGIRFWKSLQLQSNVHRLSQPLPADLRYGCYVDVQYAEPSELVHLTSKFIRVKPVQRMLTVETKMKEVVGPGEKVKIDLQVNRKEPVDLVVSVYDQSLLGIAPDRSVDIRNFYLADERVRQVQAREVLRRKIGDVTVAELVKRAERMLKESKDLANTPERQALTQLVSNHNSNRYVYGVDVATLLRLAGVEARADWTYFNYYGWNWYIRFPDSKKTERLLDILDKPIAENQNWKLTFQMFNDTLVLRETHPSHALNGGLPAYNLYQQFGNQLNQMDRGNFRARGDSHFSASGNSMYSASGQSFISHMPAPAAPVALLSTDADQSNVYMRTDFSDSAFWNANVRTDKDGKASVEFKVPDSLTNWQVVVTAVSKDMHVGQHRNKFQTFKPIMVWPMLPRIFTEGDQVAIFASVHNRSDERQTIRVRLKVENGEVLNREETYVDVEAKGNVPVYWTFKAKDPGYTQILMTAECKAGSDASLKRLPVIRSAAEQVVTLSGLCKDSATLSIPQNVNLKSAILEIHFAPSLAADLVDTLDYLVEYPHGCVEQTMSRFLPAIKVAQVFKQFQISHEKLEKKLPHCVQGGIKRLLQLQHPDGGWGWHGGSQTHEMMTPYALYGLLQAEQAGYPLGSETAIQKGLARLKQFIDSMGEAQAADRIYCMYVYAHRQDVQPEWWGFIADQLRKDKLSDYALALALEMAVQKDRPLLADELADKLRKRHQDSNGRIYWQTAGFSRWGNDRFEITAAALKALVAKDPDDKLIPGVLAYFAATKRGKQWNSTKDTAMIVYAMCDYLAKQDYRRLDRHATTFAVNGGETQRVTFPDNLTAKVVVPTTELRNGDNRLGFQSSTPGVMYRAILRYWQSGAAIAPMDKGIQVARKFYLLSDKGQRVREIKSGDSVPRGAYLESEVTATNALTHAMHYVLVENPKPACCEVQPVEDTRFNQSSTAYALREDKEGAVVFHHEATPQTITDRCVLHAELAGVYLVPPAAVELMYQTETRGHSGTFSFKVVEPDAKGK